MTGMSMSRLLMAVLALTVLFGSTPLVAQDAEFTASINRDEVAVGQQFQVTFTLSGGNLKSYTGFRQPDFNSNFLTLYGPSTSQQMQIINGKVSASIAWTYVLQPREKGNFTIGPASITYDGNTLRTNSLSIKVVDGVPQSGQQKTQQAESGDIDLSKELFIHAQVDRQNVVLGEPITVTYKLYSRIAFQLDNPIKLPRMVGFWSEDLEAPTQLKPKVEVYNGRQYEVYLLRKVVYFPTETGELYIEPFELSTTARIRQKRRSGDDFYDKFFSDPFFDNYRNVKQELRSQRIPVKVQPLPDGAPESFNGAVGDYTMETTVDRRSLKANETVTLKIAIKGEGNLELLEGPKVDFPSGLDNYAPTVEDDILRGKGKISGVKTFEYLLVPRFPGKLIIPPIEFTYFNLDKKKYVTLRSDEFTLNVAEGDASAAGGIEKTYIDYLAQDLREVQSDPGDLERRGDPAPGLLILVLLCLIPAVAAVGAIMWKQSYDRLHGDVVGLNMRRATRMAEKHLSVSRKYIEQQRIDEYYLEIARALWGYVQHKLAMPTSSTSTAQVGDVLRGKGVPEDVVGRVTAALDAVEFARFSPSRSSGEEMHALYDRARDAIVSVEQALKG